MKSITLEFGQVREKTITTPNDFISHMLEHIAWRMGCSIVLEWDDRDWKGLGLAFAAALLTFPTRNREAAALGMIDDGSGEVGVELDAVAGLVLESSAEIDLEYFLSLRCEQLTSGSPLVAILKGISEGLDARITVVVCSFADPHHTWEGIFRGVGMALHYIYAPPPAAGNFTSAEDTALNREGIEIMRCSCQTAVIRRQTAESELLLNIDFGGTAAASFRYQGTAIEHFESSQALAGLQDLLNIIASSCGFSLGVVFTSRALSSSHVLLEDTGMVLGRALREILVRRMEDLGIYGAGSSLAKPADINGQTVSVGISVEGRKSCQFVPLITSRSLLYKNLILGHTVFGGLYSEDLDDFFDGFSWGLGCSILIHCKELSRPEEDWHQLFANFGRALKQVFEVNPNRKGVPPGVKASLY